MKKRITLFLSLVLLGAFVGCVAPVQYVPAPAPVVYAEPAPAVIVGPPAVIIGPPVIFEPYHGPYWRGYYWRGGRYYRR